MKADTPLAERRRIEREQQAEIRAMLAPRHFAAMQEQMAIDAALLHIALENLKRAAPGINAMMVRMGHGPGHGPVPVAAPMVMPEPEPIAPPDPAPLVARPGAPDLPFDLRYHLGLR